MSTPSRWQAVSGNGGGEAYAARFRQRAASGCDMHGEAVFCMQMLAAGDRVLDAGCGTGRVTLRLNELGVTCVGLDVDESMLAVARAAGHEIDWRLGDLADPAVFADLRDFDLVVAAGNVIPLVAEGTEAAVLRNLAGALAPGGLLVAGFGLDAAHLPLAEAPFGIDAYDTWCGEAGLTLVARHPAWDAPPGDVDSYAVSVHRA